MKKIRVSTLLDSDTLSEIQKEADEKSISVSAVIRQRINMSKNISISIDYHQLTAMQRAELGINKLIREGSSNTFVKNINDHEKRNVSK